MNSSEVRRRFIDYFKKKGHTFVPGAPVVPADDPTIMFTNAGMNQYKDIFLGSNPKGLKSATNSQPCIRVSGKHNDLEDVGHDGTHQTLFEMLGNWSFGDYYKKEAISWAWDLLTNGFGIPKDRLYATVYETDDESVELWKSETDIRHDHILRFGKKDNFWEMGETGPCGPCSEIHVDLGDEDGTAISTDPILGVNGENERFVEFWNLVFIQYNRLADGTLEDLSQTHVDTGMGLERLVSYMQGVRSNYETDLFTPIINKIATISGHEYSASEEGTPHRVMADHVRTLIFAISDNVMPSNEGRGYVLRRLLRRALRYATKLGISEPVLFKLVTDVVAKLGDFYPHLKDREAFVTDVIKSEEETFLATLSSGEQRFLELKNELEKAGQKQISGDDAFKLYDTFGFPLDLTALMAKEAGLTVDVEGFDKALEKQKSRSRAAAKKTTYEVQDESTNVDMDALHEQMPDLYHSPHQTVARGGEARVLSSHDDKRDMARHHTATHLLHEALRIVLGTHVQQAGSLVDTDRLRFDFTHFKALTSDEIQRVTDIVNEKIKAAIPLSIEHTDLDTAKAKGAMALFGEKYDADNVRVVGIGDFSTELCGGTHVTNTDMIEAFEIIDESAIASGTRRIEAIAGQALVDAHHNAERDKLRLQVQSKHEKAQSLVAELQAADASFKNPLTSTSWGQGSKSDLQAQLDELTSLIKSLEKQVQKQSASSAVDVAKSLAGNGVSINGVTLIAECLELDMGALRTISDELVAADSWRVVVLAGTQGDKGTVVIKLGKDALSKLNAKQILDAITAVAGGGGGGRPDMIQAGGADPAKLPEALSAVFDTIQAIVKV